MGAIQLYEVAGRMANVRYDQSHQCRHRHLRICLLAEMIALFLQASSQIRLQRGRSRYFHQEVENGRMARSSVRLLLRPRSSSLSDESELESSVSSASCALARFFGLTLFHLP